MNRRCDNLVPEYVCIVRDSYKTFSDVRMCCWIVNACYWVVRTFGWTVRTCYLIIQYQRKNVTISHHIKSNIMLTCVVVRRGVA